MDNAINQRLGFGKTVLLVDDERPMRTVTRLVLERCGFTVMEAEDATDAIEVWRVAGDRIDVLVTDVMMPNGTDGRALADLVASEHPGLPTVLMSGFSPFLDVDTELPSHQRFVQKPMSAEDLIATVSAVLRRVPREQFP